MTVEARLVWETGCLLGEGPIWLANEQALYFVDIKAGRIHRFHPETGARETLDVGGQPSFVVPDGKGGLLVGSGHAVHPLVDGKLGPPIVTIDQPAHNRTNDGAMDEQGRLWFGTMDDAEQQVTGALYCLADGRLTRMGGEAVVTNGPAISADGRTLYHVDSGQRTIWRFAVNSGVVPALGTGEVFLQLDEVDGYPDGVILDDFGNLWVALWDGWGLRQYAPDGKLMRHIAIPCARVTKMALGEPDRRTAYVTTARVGLSPGQLAQQPQAGALFSFEI